MYPIGWSMCPETNTYLSGFYIDRESEDSGNYRLEEGRCSAAGLSYSDQTAVCTNANWGSVLDR